MSEQAISISIDSHKTFVLRILAPRVCRAVHMSWCRDNDSADAIGAEHIEPLVAHRCRNEALHVQLMSAVIDIAAELPRAHE